MRHLLFLCVLTLLLAASFARAQSSRPTTVPKWPSATTRPLGTAEKYTFANPQTPLKDIQLACNPSADQLAKITALQTATKKANADYQTAHAAELKTLHDELTAARDRKDSAAQVEIAQKIRIAEKPLTDAWQKARFDILALLTPEQVQAWRKANVLGSVKFTYHKITFTPDQLDKIGGLYDELAQSPNATFEDINAKLSQKLPALLTPQQKQKMSLR